jgi:hypothetical protein
MLSSSKLVLWGFGAALLVCCARVNDSNVDSQAEALGTWTLVASSAPGYSASNSRSCGALDNAAGDLLAVYAYVASSSVTLSVTDTAGNAWSAVPLSPFAGGPSSHQWFYALAKANGSDTITVKQSSGSSALGIDCFEYSGNASTGVLDVSQELYASSATTAMTTGNFTTTGSSDLVLAGFTDVAEGGVFAAGSGYESLASDHVFAAMVEGDLGVAAGTHAATATDTGASSHWQAYAVAFRSAGTSGTETLAVTKAGTGTGTVTSSPAGISCGSTCNYSFTTGTSVTLTATPSAGSTFTGWSGDCSGSACTLTMSAGHSVTANFAAGGSAWSLVASSTPGYSATNARSCASMNNAESHLLAVYAYVASATKTLSISDTMGNAWSQAPLSAFAAAGSSHQWFYTVAKSTAANTITVKQSSGSSALGIDCFEYSGNVTSSVLDTSRSANATSSTSAMSTGDFTTTAAGDLVLAGFVDVSVGGVFAPGSGYMSLASDHSFAAMVEASAGVPSGSMAATATDVSSSSQWQAYAVAFKGGGGGGGGGGGSPVYPLKVSADKRYLVDQNNVPFFIDGSSPQGLITQLSEDDADYYFSVRASQGFNSAWVDLIQSTDGNIASTYDGIAPFTTPGDFSTPNPAYFQRADDMINIAASYGISLFLLSADAYLIDLIRSNGTTKDFNYGAYIGNRYKDFPNIVWLHGNDFQTWMTSDDQLLLAIANGIKSVDSNHIHTAELSYGSTSPAGWSDTFLDPNWQPPQATLDSVYTAIPTYDWMLRAYNRGLGPVYLVEGNFEHEHNLGDGDMGTPDILRKQAYWTATSGGVGQIYGDHYEVPFLSGWQAYLDDPGAIQAGYWSSLFQSLGEWYNLVPDQTHAFFTAGYGTYDGSGNITSNTYGTASITPDGTLAVIYTPTVTALTIDMASFSGSVGARWFDPSSNAFTAIVGSPFSNSGSRSFTPPGLNASGFGDWVLLLQVSP